MISDAAGGGLIRQDVQKSIQAEISYRLGEGDAPGVLSRWQKELILLVINATKSNACLSELHARAAMKAGADLDQVLQALLYIMLTGMVTWVKVGMGAFTAAEAEVGESKRAKPGKGISPDKDPRMEEIQQYLRKVLHHEMSDSWKKLFEVAPGALDGYIRMRESFISPDPASKVPKKVMELAIASADIVQAHEWGAVRHARQAIIDGASVAETVEAVALVVIECGVPIYKTGGLDVIEAAEKAAAELSRPA